jgi:hypothetical protein
VKLRFRFLVRTPMSVCGGQSARSSWMVRDEPTDQVFIVFFASSFVSSFRSVLSGAFGCLKFDRQFAR